VKLGFESVQDIVGVLLVPISAALLAAFWPSLSARRRRINFEDLIMRELEEAAPHKNSMGGTAPWHEYLTKRFLHEQIIEHPVENADFVLSLKPELSYNLSQMWIEFNKAKAESEDNRSSLRDHAAQFLWYLHGTVTFLDDRHGTSLAEKVWTPWKELIEAEYPEVQA